MQVFTPGIPADFAGVQSQQPSSFKRLLPVSALLAE
jgi:hypothetical protein